MAGTKSMTMVDGTSQLRVLELYSGIGGMHWALTESGVSFQVVMAVDINTTANEIYKANFPDTLLHSFAIEKLTLKKFEALEVNTIMMSPPCQPFTRVGKKKDCNDVRTKSFLHVLQILRETKKKPVFVLIENVKGFETSETHAQLVDCLEDCGYEYQEFLLTPLQFGIPNSRLRYYMIAKHKQPFSFHIEDKISFRLPEPSEGIGRSVMQSNSMSLPHKRRRSPSDECSLSCAASRNCNSKEKHASYFGSNVSRTEPCLLSETTLDEKSEKLKEHHGCDTDRLGLSTSRPNVKLSYIEKSVDKLASEEEIKLSAPKDTLDNPDFVSGKEPKYPSVLCPENVERLKAVGRNMRYCEEEDELVNSDSRCLLEFMQEGQDEDFKEFCLSDRDLRMFVVMDIVFPALKKSTCFTKRYGHYIEGAGSIVQMSTNVQDVEAASEFKSKAVELKNRREWSEAEYEILKRLKLRYFTPREVANLLCFPRQLVFPSKMSSVQLYRVLGNSLNVHVVSELIKVMTHGDFDS